MQDKGEAVKANILQNVQNKFKSVRHYKSTINIKMQQIIKFHYFPPEKGSNPWKIIKQGIRWQYSGGWNDKHFSLGLEIAGLGVNLEKFKTAICCGFHQFYKKVLMF